ncbi:MAG: hypothetical protein LBJ67_07920 [Planctomycetaceae bacterium]|jgi:hypothetical protein|nr:hypothetical protein [Planctomycetaceae bacterium]
MKEYTICLICVFFAIFCDTLAVAQPSGRRPRGESSSGRTRPFSPRNSARGSLPPGITTSPNTPASLPDIGTVPDFSGLDVNEPLDARSFLDRATVSQPLSPKMLRYTEHLIAQYDTNGNGKLEIDEWYEKMSGSPQVMDLNGDNILTLDELANHIEKFSRWRTIHNPYPLQQLIANQVISVQENTDSLFRPLIKNVSTLKSSIVDTSNDSETLNNILSREQAATDEEIEVGKNEITENETETSTNSAEKSQSGENYLTGKIPPAQTRKYAAPTQGLPTWFVRCDLDGDGQVSLYEFASPGFTNESVARFGRLDKNADGFITSNELPK